MSCTDAPMVELLPTLPPRCPSPARTGATAAGGRERCRTRPGWSPGDANAKLRRREAMVEGKRRLSAGSLLVAGLGIGLMMVSVELSWQGCPRLIIETLRATMTFSTLLLLVLILAYHMRDIQLFMIDKNIGEWRVALTRERKLCVTLELLVCLVHPFPVAFLGTSDTLLSTTGIILSNLMFLRIYLVQRVIFMFSKVLNPSYQSIGSLSKIQFSFHFVLKILMSRCPGKILLLFIFFVWFIGSWTLSLCERENHHNGTNSIVTSMWLIPITFLTIGYGDMVPVTTCGKFICLITGALGVSCTALFIAVIAKKLELSKDEKHVHNFMRDIQLTKEVQKVAADLIGVAWLLYKHRKQEDRHRVRKYHRDLFSTVCRFRKTKLRQKKLRDQISTMMDLSKIQLFLYDMNSKMDNSYSQLEERLGTLATRVEGLAVGFEELRCLICEAFKQQPKE
uniref:intermediate conductance calcium-activated potassium channel protein 4-like n=1 Tax=Pristiophorus japonicus TaxID=55135 RepID=UPI00398E9F06